MSFQSLRLLFAWICLLRTVVSVPQASPSPTSAAVLVSAEQVGIGAPSGTASGPSCNRCVVVADGAALIWYSEIFINTAAFEQVNIATGNGTGRSTRTTIVQQDAQFTFNPGKTGTTNLALTSGSVVYNSTHNLNGADLTSPTAYNVISAYSVTSEYISGDQCSTYLGTRISLSPAYSVALPTISGKVIFKDGNQDFINFLHISTCSNGGQSVTQVPLLQVRNVTAARTSTIASQPLSAAGLTLASTTIGTIRTSLPGGVATLSDVVSTAAVTLSPLKGSQLASSGVASSTGTAQVVILFANSTSNSPSTTTSYPSAYAPVIVIGSSTITPYGNPINLPFYTPSSGDSSKVTISLPNGSVTTGVVIVIPSGTAGGNYTATVLPFASEADSWRRDRFWMSLWVAGLAAIGALICWL